MPTAAGQFSTPNASRYLKQLCKHFAHKVVPEFADMKGSAELPGSRLLLRANDEAFAIQIESDDANRNDQVPQCYGEPSNPLIV